MLVIRREQMAALTAPHRERFIEKILATMPSHFPDDSRLLDKEAMRAEIRDAIERAAAYGVSRDREVGLYVLLVHEFGAGFEERPEKRWIGDILRTKDMDEQSRLDVIYKRLALAAQRSGK